jgi:hypothetical protein
VRTVAFRRAVDHHRRRARQLRSLTRLGPPPPVPPVGVIMAAAGKPDNQRPATVWVLGNDGLRRVPFDGDCWQADW